jgi:hypothetical protein
VECDSFGFSLYIHDQFITYSYATVLLVDHHFV